MQGFIIIVLKEGIKHFFLILAYKEKELLLSNLTLQEL